MAIRPIRSLRVPRLSAGAGLWLLAILALTVVAFYPVYALVKTSLTSGGALSVAHYARIAADGGFWRALSNSLEVSLLATVGGTLLGAVLAWLVVRTDLPGRRWLKDALTIPYLIPPFIGAIAWLYLLGPVGYLNQMYMALTGSAEPLFTVYGQWGVVLVMMLYGFPIPYLVLIGPLQRMDPALEEAARMAGARPWRVALKVTFPLMLPSLGAGAVLLFMSLLANFGIPAVLGFPAKFFVLTTRIYSTVLNFDLKENLAVAAAMSLVLGLVGIACVWLQQRLLRQGAHTVVAGKAGRNDLVSLGAWRWPAFMAVGGVVLLTAVAPLAAILLTALTKAVGAGVSMDNMTLKHFETAMFSITAARRAFMNSILLAGGAAAVVTTVGTVLAYMIVRLKIRGGKLLEGMISLLYTVPGTVVALALILAWLKPVFGIRLYNTPWILLLAYAGRFMIMGVRTVGAAMEQVHESLEEAARMSGATRLQAFWSVVWPLVWPSLYATALLVMVPSLTELTMSALLYSVGNETIGVVIFNLHEEGKAGITAALAVLLVIVVFALNGLANRTTRGKLDV